MADVKAPVHHRPAADILGDIHTLMAAYPPFSHDRQYLNFAIENGKVIVSGHVVTRVTLRFIQANIPDVAGVEDVDFSGLYNDEELRLEVGQVIPHGVYVNIKYGAVALTGHLPEGVSAEDVVAKVGQVAGVTRVMTAFRA